MRDLAAFEDAIARAKLPADLHPMMRFEILNLADGRRTALEIHEVVAAQALSAGAWYYGTVNAAQVKLTGKKEEQKLYRYHSGYEGGLREERAKIVRQKDPIRLVEEAVRGMLPKTKMGDAMWRKLKVYTGADHPHAAQKPRAAKTTRREVA